MISGPDFCGLQSVPSQSLTAPVPNPEQKWKLLDSWLPGNRYTVNPATYRILDSLEIPWVSLCSDLFRFRTTGLNLTIHSFEPYPDASRGARY